MAPNRELQRLGQIATEVVWETDTYQTVAAVEDADSEKLMILREANDRIIGHALVAAIEAVGGAVLPAKTAAVTKRSPRHNTYEWNPWNVALYDASRDPSYRWSVGAPNFRTAMKMANAWVNGRWDGAFWDKKKHDDEEEAA